MKFNKYQPSKLTTETTDFRHELNSFRTEYKVLIDTLSFRMTSTHTRVCVHLAGEGVTARTGWVAALTSHVATEQTVQR